MCRNIKTLFNFDPPATEDEVQAAALQYVRKVSGQQKPSAANTEAFEAAVNEIADITHQLLAALTTKQPPKNRQEEARKAKLRSQRRFG